MSALAFLVYLILQVLLLPLAILGAVLVGYRQIRVSQRLGVSQTAIEIINGRWAMDVFGLRRDKATRKLARKLPNNSVLGLWMALLPFYLTYQLTGKRVVYPRIREEGRELFTDLVIARTPIFDRYIHTHNEDAQQIVFLGAGFDTRAYGTLEDRQPKIFELDQEATQRLKRKALARAKILHDHVHFVTVDFTKSDWTQTLTSADFDTSKKTVFVWEGVTLYLSEDEVRKTIENLKPLSGPNSVVVTDFYAEHFLSFARRGAGKKLLETTGETFGFGLEFEKDHEETLQLFVESLSVRLARSRFLGAASRKGPYAVIAELVL